MNRRRKIAIIATIFVVIIVLISIYYFVILNERIPDDKKTKPVQISVSPNIWPQYRYIFSHDGRAHPEASLNGEISNTWVSTDINIAYYGASKSSPAVDYELVFIGADTGKLHAFNRSSGKEVWSYQTRISKNGIHGSPAFDNLKVYIGAYDGWLYAIYKQNGTLAWESKLGDYIGSSPCLYKGVVYIGVEMAKPAGYLVGCNMTTGLEVFRSKEFGSHPHSSPSIDPVREYVYIGANDQYVYCYDLNSKQEVWKYKTEGDVKSTPCVAGDILYVTSWDYNIHAFDLSTGERYFSFKTGMRTMSSPSIDSAGKRAYFGSHDGYIYCIDAREGEEIWKYKTDKLILSSPILVEKDETVICGSNDGYVYILNAKSGKIEEQINIESGVTSVPVIVENQLYIFDNEGRLHRFDAN